MSTGNNVVTDRKLITNSREETLRTSSLVNYDQNNQKNTPNISGNRDSIHEVSSPGAFKSSTSNRVQAVYRDNRDSQNNTPMGY